MISYKKIIPIALTLAAFTFGGIGCAKDPQNEPIEVKEYNSTLKRGNIGLRKQMHKDLNESTSIYAIKTDKHEITAQIEYPIAEKESSLTIIIYNRKTKDTLKLCDYGANGDIDYAEYNGIRNGKDGMEERFDKALEIVKPRLEKVIKTIEENKKFQEKVKQSVIDKVTENTELP